MITNRCEPSSCYNKESCNRYLLCKGRKIDVLNEDLSDICMGERLYIKGLIYQGFPKKAYYVDLLNFWDTYCEGTNCSHRKDYAGVMNEGKSAAECQCGDNYTCKHELHPTNNFIRSMFSFMLCESKAFREAGIKYGKIEFECPLCGGKAIGNRYDGGSLGSGCTQCVFSHT